MHPVIARFGPITIYSYGVMVAVAFLFGIYIARIEAIRKNINVELVYDLGFYIIIASVAGARIYYLIFFDPGIFTIDPLSVFKIWQGGLAIHGGIIGGVLAGLIFSRIRKISFWKLADMLAPSIILGQAIGRIGCFLNGCCFGVPTESIFGVRFPNSGMAVHPTQLYESILNLVGFFALWALRKKTRFDGGLFLLYLMIYNSIRILVSGLRGDSLYIWGTGFKIEQIISALIFIAAFFIFVRKKRHA